MIVKLSETRREIGLENEVLLCVARLGSDCERAERLRVLVQSELKWDYLLDRAEWHGLTPLLYQQLNTTCKDLVPERISAQLREQFLTNTQNNLRLSAELLRILRLFESHGISAVPFKGPTLAVTADGNLALRQFNDLDFLLHENDITQGTALLESQGYQTQYSLSKPQSNAYLQSLCQVPMISSDESTLIELHSGLTPRDLAFPLNSEGLWQRLKPVMLCGRQIQTFSPEDLLLLLCVHGAKHLWPCLGWICDVARLATTHPEINWGYVMEQGTRLRAERMLFLGLFMANDLLEAPLPEETAQKVQAESAVRILAETVYQLLFGEPQGWAGFASFSFHLKVREHLSDGVKYSFSLSERKTPSTNTFFFNNDN